MNRIRLTVAAGAVLTLGALSVACRDEPVAPTRDQAALQAADAQADFHIASDLGVRILGSHRSPLREGIVHYTYDVAVGPGQYDVIRLHRVVRERHLNRPAEDAEGVLLLPGAPNSVEMIFIQPLISPVPPWDQSVAIFLAQNGIDVWAMDYAWALVPAGTTDFGFMRGWGAQRDIRDIEKALAVARSFRASSGHGDDRLNLLGFSYGVWPAYAVAADETQLPPGRRTVKGLIPVDSWVLTDDSAMIAWSCADIAAEQGLIDAGIYQSDVGLFIQQAGHLAESAPNDVSPFAPPLTNWQFYLASAVGFYGETFDASGNATGFRFTDPRLAMDMSQAVPPYSFPVRTVLDWDAATCYKGDVSFFRHFDEVAIPILFISSAGGTGVSGFYNAAHTASRDVTTFEVHFYPPDQWMKDFGHADLFAARSAERLVWRPILNWILAHRTEHREFAEARH